MSKQSFGTSNLVTLLQNQIFYKVVRLIQEELDNGMQDVEYLDLCFRNLEVRTGIAGFKIKKKLIKCILKVFHFRL